MKKLSQNPEVTTENGPKKRFDNQVIGILASIGTISALSFAPASFATNSSSLEPDQTTNITERVTKPEISIQNSDELIARYPNYRRPRGLYNQPRRGIYTGGNDEYEYNNALEDLDRTVSRCNKIRNINCRPLIARVESVKAFARVALLQPNFRNLVIFVDESLTLRSLNTDYIIATGNTNYINDIEVRRSSQSYVRNILIDGDGYNYKGARYINLIQDRTERENFTQTYIKGVFKLLTDDIRDTLNRF